MVDFMSKSGLVQRCCVAHTPKCLRGRKTYTSPSLQSFAVFFFSNGRDSFYNISQFISSEPEPFLFLPFSVQINSSLHRSQGDVLSDSYSCVIEHALWKGHALSVAKSSLALLQLWGNAFTALAVMQMSKSLTSSVVPVVPTGPSGQDMPYLNTGSLSVKSHTINSMEALQTVNCQAINSLSFTLCLSLTSYRPHLRIIGEKCPF